MKSFSRSLGFIMVFALIFYGLSPIRVNAIPSANSLILGSDTDVILERTAVSVDSGITATFEGTVTKLKVSITNGVYGDVLTAPNHPGCSYDSLGFSLSCFGTFSASDATSILRDVTFDSLSSDTTARTIDFWVGTSIIPYEVSPGVYHYYEYIGDNLSWSGAKAAASARTFEGMTGYLATVTSSGENEFISTKLGNNAWLGASDDYQQINLALGSTVYASQAESEGKWYWVCGPEAGTRISNNNVSPIPVDGAYNAWASGEPNNSGGEHYMEIYVSGQRWNDLPNGPYGFGYVVEYSGGSDVNLISLNATKTLVFDATVVRYISDNDEVTGSVPVDMNAYLPGDQVTVMGNPGNLRLNGGVFIGWSDGTNTYVAGDTFIFTERTILRAVFVELSMSDSTLYVFNDGSEVLIDEDLYYGGLWSTKFSVQIIGAKTGDELIFDKADGTYRYNVDGYVYYTMASVFDDATSTLTITTSIPIPYWQIENYLNYHTYFRSTGSEGDRSLKVSIYRNADSILISGQRTLTVYDGYTVTYQGGDGYAIDPDSNTYSVGDWFTIHSPYELDDAHQHFLFWVDQFNRLWFTDSNYPIKSDLVLTPVFASSVKDTLGLTDLLTKEPGISDFSDYISMHHDYYDNYEAWKVFITVFGLSENQMDPDDLDQLKSYVLETYPLNDHQLYMMDISLWIAYWAASDDMPTIDRFQRLTDADEEPYLVTVTLQIPEALRGKSDYKIIRIHDGILTVLTPVIDKVNWTLSFETDRFSSYTISYANTQELPDTGEAATFAWILLLGAIGLFGLSRKTKHS